MIDSYNGFVRQNTLPFINSNRSSSLRTTFLTRFKCMQSWFIRCSWTEKFNFLSRMLCSLNSLSALSNILNTILTCSGKASIYSIQNNSDFVYDKRLNDHNRSLHKTTLKEVQQQDLQWFKSFTDDSEKVLLFIGLLRLGGGLIIYEIYKKGVQLYERVSQQQPIAAPVKTSLESTKTTTSSQTPFLKDQLKGVPSTLELDPTDPYVIYTATVRKKWEDAFQKYKNEVYSRTQTALPKSNAKPSKKNKKGKGKKNEGSTDLDFIQLLPICVAKKIFNYLDASALKKVRNVNKYWEFVVKDLLKEQKERKNLDKFIKKMGTGNPINVVDDDFDVERPKKLTTVYDYSYPKTRLKRLWTRGAVLPTLIPPLLEPLTENSLTTAVKGFDEYFSPLQNVGLFPQGFSTAPLLFKEYSNDNFTQKA